MQTALEKLNAVVGAKAAWFQLMEGEHLVPTQHVGLSPELLRALGTQGRVQLRLKYSMTTARPVVKLSQMSDLERVRLGSAAFVTLYWCRCGAKNR